MLTNTFWIKKQIANKTLEKTYVVPKHAEFRPDVISNDIYGSDSYGIHVMVYNNILDPFKDLKKGTILKYPPFDQLSKIL